MSQQDTFSIRAGAEGNTIMYIEFPAHQVPQLIEAAQKWLADREAAK